MSDNELNSTGKLQRQIKDLREHGTHLRRKIRLHSEEIFETINSNFFFNMKQSLKLFLF